MRLNISVPGKLCAFVLVMLWGIAVGYGQGLKLGEQLPEVAVSVLNSGSGSLRLSDYKDRLLILDFWSTACGTCIEDMPAVAALQDRYTGKLMVVDVDFETESRVKAFYGRRPDLEALKTPVVAGDVVLRKLFPHRFEPHLVWIDHGVYVAATEGDYLTVGNIDSILRRGKAGLRQKVDAADVDMKMPLSAYSKRVLYGCTFTGFLRGLPPKAGLVQDTAAGTLRYYLLNQGLLHLYAYALKSGLPLTANRRILHVPDSSDYLNVHGEYQDAWDEKHSYSFECLVPAHTDQDLILGPLKHAMEMSLGIHGNIAQLLTDVYALRKVGAGPALSSYDKKKTSLTLAKPAFVHHVNAGYLVDLMNAPADLLPVVDETGCPKSFDLELGTLPKSFLEWSRALRGHGLELVRCRRVLDMFVLWAPGPNNNLQSTLKPKS